MRYFCIALALFACLIVGCGNSGDRGKNRDRDVPKAADAPAK